MIDNHTSSYRKYNKIIEYVNGDFIVRSLGIDESPIIQDRYVVESTADNVFQARHLAGAVVFNSRMWVMGGTDGSQVFQSVHSSTDGKFWTTQAVGQHFVFSPPLLRGCQLLTCFPRYRLPKGDAAAWRNCLPPWRFWPAETDAR